MTGVGNNPPDLNDRKRAIDATKILADLARDEDNNPTATLEILKSYEVLVAGLPNDPQSVEFKNKALRDLTVTRARAYMKLEKVDQAIAEVVKLLQDTKDNQAIGMVSDLIHTLDTEFDKASKAGDEPKMQAAATNKARLTGFLVNWSNPAKGADAKASQYFYRFSVYDAKTQLDAGLLTQDPAKRAELMTKAKKNFMALQDKAMKDRYLAIEDVAKPRERRKGRSGRS